MGDSQNSTGDGGGIKGLFRYQSFHNAVVKQHPFRCQGTAAFLNNHQILLAKHWQDIPVLLIEIHLK